LIQNCSDPLGFLTKRIGAAKGALLALIKPLCKFSTRYCFMACSSFVD
jgi:hypothetical protein